MDVRERISLLRKRMTDEGIDYVLIGSSDYHASEYVGDYFKVSEFFSGCTSDNVTLIIGADIAELWTDGRYFISAEIELKGDCVSEEHNVGRECPRVRRKVHRGRPGANV